MTGRAKIEGLTNAWYGYVLTSAVLSFLAGSWGIFSIAGRLTGLGISLLIVWAIGRSLVKKSSLMRTVLLLVTAFCTITGVLGIGRATLYLFDSFSFSLVF